MQRARRPLLRLRQAGDASKAGPGSGGHHGGGGLPFHDEAAGMNDLARAGVGGHALTGEGRRVERERVHHLQSQIGRDAIALTQEHRVASDDVGGRDLRLHAVPQDGHAPRQQVPQALSRMLGALLLHEREHAVQHHDDEHRDAELGHPGDEGKAPGHPEQQGEEVEHLRR